MILDDWEGHDYPLGKLDHGTFLASNLGELLFFGGMDMNALLGIHIPIRIPIMDDNKPYTSIYHVT